MSQRLSRVLLGVLVVTCCVADAQRHDVDGASLTTGDRMNDPGWWPTKEDVPRSRYAGQEACKSCHGEIAAAQSTTPMYHAAIRAPESELLKGEGLVFEEPGVHYQLRSAVEGVTLSASDGSQTSTTPVTWAFGAGVYGQTYILERSDTYIEGRLSYFTRTHALDITPGQSGKIPHTAEDAVGKKLDSETARLCFGCHTTEAIVSGRLDTKKANPGVNCEACHGPGSAHVAAMRSEQNDQALAAMFNPKNLSPSDSVDFCGACHRTWADVAMAMSPNIGVASVRFQPYRLEKSRCWGNSGDARITCVACHDPHQPLVHLPGAYDIKCLACHAQQRSSKTHGVTKSCVVGTSNCVSCHMPKVEVPEAHASFTDHYIRVVGSRSVAP